MGTMTIAILALALCSLLAYPLIRRFSNNAFPILAFAPGIAFLAFCMHSPGDSTVVESFTWLPQIWLDLTFRLNSVSWLFALLVTGAGSLILFYCRSYFADSDEGLARFGSVFLGFTTSMLGLVLADNIFLLFIFWEATTIFSFLLIGQSYWQRTSRSAALQALMVTTAGGLAMLVGMVILTTVVGNSNLSVILEAAPSGTLVTVAVYLLLAGALSKSAIFPFHFWLPGAMAAPTPVSAYLHAASMVKAGVFLIALLGPAFGDTPGFRETLVILGGVTMLNGGYRALKQFDIKLIVAHGTVSQLGLLVMIFGLAYGTTDFSGFALLFAHALAKAPLFLVVGIIDHRTGTRDLRQLSGLGKQAPLLFITTLIAAASMAGVPPFFGFIAKESAFTEVLELTHATPLAWIAFAFAVLGSVLTVAYMIRFVWGAFASKRGVATCVEAHKLPAEILIAPIIFAASTLLAALFAPFTDGLLQPTVAASGAHPEHLALWHGVNAALLTSLGVFVVGTLLAIVLIRGTIRLTTVPERFSASHVYWLITHSVDVLAVRLTALTQRGSLPFYLAVILSVMVITIASTLVGKQTFPESVVFFTSPAQIPIALVMVLAAIFALRARTRFQAVVLVGVTGYGMAALFALHGAPDLALTQALVETVTLIAFVLVIRRLPQHITIRATAVKRWMRASLGIGVGLIFALMALVSLQSRIAEPISLQLPQLAYSGGHGSNVVNVMLVDIRGWDTLGELSVILAAATGVASLVFLNTRVDRLPKMSRRIAQTQVKEQMRRISDPSDPASRRSWLLAGRNLDPSRRSILLEVVVRLIFHALILLSFYLLLTGHNTPGGGFAGGLVAGLALVARYLTGGREELGATVPIDAGRILGAGLALAATMATIPLLFGQSALASWWYDVDLGMFGTLPLVSSTLFDIGVYLVVFGLVLDVLRSLGAEVDRQEIADRDEPEALEPAITYDNVNTAPLHQITPGGKR